MAEFNNAEWATRQPLLPKKNIEAVEQIVMHDRQISIRRLAEELTIPKTTIHEIMNNHMDMKKVCTRWVKKLLTPVVPIVWIVVKSEVNPVNFFDSIVTGDESWIHHYDSVSQLEAKIWKRSGEQTPTPLRQERSARKMMMMMIF